MRTLFDESHLRQIDRLHYLMFEWLGARETRLWDDVMLMVKNLVSERWKQESRIDTEGGYKLIGLMSTKVPISWPTDLLVHFGWQDPLLYNVPWVGIDTRADDLNLKQRICEAVRPAFDAQLYGEPKVQPNDRYIIWQAVPDWPQIDPKIIRATDKLSKLASILNDSALVWVKDHLTKILLQLDKLGQDASL
jgi:hypothetical protein